MTAVILYIGAICYRWRWQLGTVFKINIAEEQRRASVQLYITNMFVTAMLTFVCLLKFQLLYA